MNTIRFPGKFKLIKVFCNQYYISLVIKKKTLIFLIQIFLIGDKLKIYSKLIKYYKN
jgi:hypothetical protein